MKESWENPIKDYNYWLENILSVAFRKKILNEILNKDFY
jgi:hypothetical protein